MTSVTPVPESTEFTLRLQSDGMQVRYAVASAVQLLEEECKYAQSGGSTIDYRQFNTVKRRELAKSLSPDICTGVNKKMAQGSTVSWGIKEVLYRLPVVMEIEVVNPEEARGIVNISVESAADYVQLEMVRSRLQSKSAVLVLLHSESPEHYTMLSREVKAEGPVHQYFDSLRLPSASGRDMAKDFMKRMQWNGPVPPVSNQRYQTDGWECGYWCLQFVEEFLRSLRGELVIKYPVKVNTIISRVNDFIGKVRPSLPDKSEVAKPPVPVSAEEVHSSVLVALTAAAPVPSGPVLSMPLQPLGIDKWPAAAVDAVDVGELTVEQAQSAKSTCSKCKFQGCTHCMGKWFLTKAVLKDIVDPKAPKGPKGSKSKKGPSLEWTGPSCY